MADTISDTSVSSDEFVSCPESRDDSGVMAASTINPVREQKENNQTLKKSHKITSGKQNFKEKNACSN